VNQHITQNKTSIVGSRQSELDPNSKKNKQFELTPRSINMIPFNHPWASNIKSQVSSADHSVSSKKKRGPPREIYINLSEENSEEELDSTPLVNVENKELVQPRVVIGDQRRPTLKGTQNAQLIKEINQDKIQGYYNSSS
jgi:hypothetical protein